MRALAICAISRIIAADTQRTLFRKNLEIGDKTKMDTITKEMTIGEVVEKFPQSVEVFLRHGLMCFGCAVARFENVEVA